MKNTSRKLEITFSRLLTKKGVLLGKKKTFYIPYDDSKTTGEMIDEFKDRVFGLAVWRYCLCGHNFYA